MAKKENKSSLKRTRPLLRRVLTEKKFRDCFSYGLLSSINQTKENGESATDFSERLAPHVDKEEYKNVFGGLYYIMKTMSEFTRPNCLRVGDVESVCSTLTYLARIAPRQFVSLNWTSALPNTSASWTDDAGLTQSVTFPRFRHNTRIGNDNLRHNFNYSLRHKVVEQLAIPYNAESRLAVEFAIEMGWMPAEADLGALDISVTTTDVAPTYEQSDLTPTEPETAVAEQTDDFFSMTKIEDPPAVADVSAIDMRTLTLLTSIASQLTAMNSRLNSIEARESQHA
jgi:hypothetical protein